MRYAVLLLSMILMFGLATGCNRAPANAPSEPSNQATPEPSYFAFERDHIVKATIYRGDSTRIAEVTDIHLDTLARLLDQAKSYAGAVPADLPYTITLESQDGTMRTLSVTGNGHVFTDDLTQITYSLDKEAFEAFVGKLQAADE